MESLHDEAGQSAGAGESERPLQPEEPGEEAGRHAAGFLRGRLLHLQVPGWSPLLIISLNRDFGVSWTSLNLRLWQKMSHLLGSTDILCTSHALKCTATLPYWCLCRVVFISVASFWKGLVKERCHI